MSILTPPLSKRGILKALGQDPSKSDVLTVSTNSDGGIDKVIAAGGKKYRGFEDVPQRGLAAWKWTDGTLVKTSSNAGEAFSIDADGNAVITVSSSGSMAFTASLTPSAPFYLGGVKTIQIPVFIPINYVANDLQLWLYGETSGQTLKITVPMQTYVPGAWNVISWSRDSNFTGVLAPLDAERINLVTVLITTSALVNAAPENRTIKLGPVTANARRKGRIIWYLDGCYRQQQQYILPILESCGIKASMALTNYWIGSGGSYMTKAQVEAAFGRGHVGCHHTFGASQAGYANATDWPTSDAIYNDLMSQWAYFQSLGKPDWIGHVVKGYTGYWNSTTAAAAGRDALIKDAFVRAGVKSLRSGGIFNAAAGGIGQLTPLVDPKTNMFCFTGGSIVSATDTVSGLKSLIDAVESRGELAAITLHQTVVDSGTPAGNQIKNSDLAAVARYAQDRERAGGIVNQTIVDAYADIVGA